MFIADLGRDSKKPLFERLYLHFRGEIENGRLRPDEKLPSRRQLAARLKLSQGTVESAYAQLLAEGYVYVRKNSGYYVSALGPVVSEEKRGRDERAPEERGEEGAYRYRLLTNAVATDKFPFATWAKLMRECLGEDARALLSSTHPQGDAELRGEIVKYLRKYRGIDTAPRQIVIGAGSELLLSLIVQLLGRERLYAVENPGYRKTRSILDANGARTVPVSLDEWGVRVDVLANLGVSVAHVTPSHHFPLATVMPVARRMQLLQWASSEERYIVEDDYDSEFRFSGRPIPALQCLEGGGDRVIYINTFTKSLAPSLRISYMVLPEALLSKYRKTFPFNSCTVPSFEQRTLWRFFSRGHFERHLNRMKNTYKARRDAFIASLRERCGDRVAIAGENTGLHLLVSVKNGMSEEELVRRAETKGVQVRGLSTFYFESIDGLSPSTIVLGYAGYDERGLVGAARLLADAWFGSAQTLCKI